METIIRSFSEQGTFIQPDTLDYIMSKKNPKKFTSFLKENLKEYPLVLTLEQIKNIEDLKENVEKTPDHITEEKFNDKIISRMYKQELNTEDFIKNTIIDYNKIQNKKTCFSTEKKDVSSSKKTNLKKIKSWKPKAKEYDPQIEIKKDITGKSTCEGTTDDFAKLFANRFKKLKQILQKQRREMANVIPIKRVTKTSSKDIHIAGIVKEVRNTKNGHRLIELEDKTDTATCIALKNNRKAINLAREVVYDEVIGINGQVSKKGDLILINNIVFPDISIQNGKHRAEDPVCAAFLSDIHAGSEKFLGDEWNAFIKWINGKMGNSRQREVAGRIKYLVLPGDLVDGIGIYPKQEEELSITDVYKQYEELAEQLECIPDYISIIMQPGNHDAVRPAEPQPTFGKEIQDLFAGKDIKFVGNPCYLSLHGVEILSYHGQSLLDFSTNIQSLQYDQPVEIMKHMLKKHHLAPTYGGYTPLAPECKDYMIIDKVPDIFVTGHVHLSTIGEYRGVTLINASSWQSQTEYQKMLNFVPDPAKLPIADLKTGNMTMMDFSKNL